MEILPAASAKKKNQKTSKPGFFLFRQVQQNGGMLHPLINQSFEAEKIRTNTKTRSRATAPTLEWYK